MHLPAQCGGAGRGLECTAQKTHTPGRSMQTFTMQAFTGLTRVYAVARLNLSLDTCTRIRTRTLARTRTRACTSTRARARARTRTCTCTHTRTSIRTSIRTHTSTRTRTRRGVQGWCFKVHALMRTWNCAFTQPRGLERWYHTFIQRGCGPAQSAFETHHTSLFCAFSTFRFLNMGYSSGQQNEFFKTGWSRE